MGMEIVFVSFLKSPKKKNYKKNYEVSSDFSVLSYLLDIERLLDEEEGPKRKKPTLISFCCHLAMLWAKINIWYCNSKFLNYFIYLLLLLFFDKSTQNINMTGSKFKHISTGSPPRHIRHLGKKLSISQPLHWSFLFRTSLSVSIGDLQPSFSWKVTNLIPRWDDE